MRSLVPVLALFSLTACEGTPTTCGEGTVLEGTQCVADGGGGNDNGDSVTCGVGTTEVDDECVPDVECGPGTVANTDGECVPAASVECGPGTHLDDSTDECVPDVTCGPGTHVSDDGTICEPDPGITCGAGTTLVGLECVGSGVDPSACGAGTHWNASTEACDPDEVCGVGTSANTDGECIPDSVVTCGPGTELSVAGDECVPDGSGLTCGSGTFELAGACVPYVDLLASGPTVDAVEPDDPEVLDDTSSPWGDPVDMPPLAVGEVVVLQGVIEPPTVAPWDSSLFIQDWDVFEFTGSAGQVYEVRGYSAGLPAPFVEVRGYDTGTAGWSRQTATVQGNQPTRQVVLPIDGAYQLRVGDESALFADGGSTAWQWYVEVERLDDLDVTGLTAQPVPTTLSGDHHDVLPNLFWVQPENAGDNTVLIDVIEQAPEYHPHLMVFDNSLGFLHEVPVMGSSATVEVPDAGAYVLVDWQGAMGLPSSGFQYDLGTLSCLDPVATGLHLDGGEEGRWCVLAGAGEVVEIGLQNYPGGHEFSMYPLNQSGDRAFTGYDEIFWFTPVDQPVFFEVVNDNALTGMDFDVVTTLNPATMLPELDPAGGAPSTSGSTPPIVSAEETWFAVPAKHQGPLDYWVTAQPDTGNDAFYCEIFEQSAQLEALGYVVAFQPGSDATGPIAVGGHADSWIVGQCELGFTSGPASATIMIDPMGGSGGNTYDCSSGGDDMFDPLDLDGEAAFEIDFSNCASNSNDNCQDLFSTDGPDFYFRTSVPPFMTAVITADGVGQASDPALSVAVGDSLLQSGFCQADNHDQSQSDLSAQVVVFNDSSRLMELWVAVDNRNVGLYKSSDTVSVDVALGFAR